MKSFIIFLKGMLMGAAAIIPGVSSGTVIVILKLYDKLVEAVNQVLSFKKGWFQAGIFLAILLGGNVFAMIALSTPMSYLLDRIPELMQLFFIGIVIGSLPMMVRYMNPNGDPLKFKMKEYLVFNIPLVLLVTLSLLTEPTEEYIQLGSLSLDIVIIYLAVGMIASATALIPGISGSMVLVLLGFYPVFVKALAELNLVVIAIFGVGGLIGSVVVVKVMNYFLTHHHKMTYLMILGLLIGSVFSMFPSNVFKLPPLTWVLGLVMFTFGFSITYYTNIIDQKKH
jgi:putative membrane protein